MMSAYLHQNSKSLSFEHPPLVKQTYEDNFVQECKISTIYFINFNKICLLMMLKKQRTAVFFFTGGFGWTLLLTKIKKWILGWQSWFGRESIISVLPEEFSIRLESIWGTWEI